MGKPLNLYKIIQIHTVNAKPFSEFYPLVTDIILFFLFTAFEIYKLILIHHSYYCAMVNDCPYYLFTVMPVHSSSHPWCDVLTYGDSRARAQILRDQICWIIRNEKKCYCQLFQIVRAQTPLFRGIS